MGSRQRVFSRRLHAWTKRHSQLQALPPMNDFVLVSSGPVQPPFVLSYVIVLLTLPCVFFISVLCSRLLSGSIWLAVVPFRTLVTFGWSLYLLPCFTCCWIRVVLFWLQRPFFSFRLLLFTIIAFRFSAGQPEPPYGDSSCLNLAWGGVWPNSLRSYLPST